MKRFIIFVLSFILLFGIFQVLSGLLLTLFYVPNISSTWAKTADLPQHIEFGRVSAIPFLIAILSAVVAYFIPNIFLKKGNNSK